MPESLGRKRLDQILAEQGLAESRNRAQALIAAGKVTVNGTPETKPGRMVSHDANLTVTERDHPWVSRGGIKLAAALDHFSLDPSGRIALDIGASTGGFTDVLVTRGAARVYAIDVGHGQLSAKLRNDTRVISIEHMNARHLTQQTVPERVGVIVCDVSFIGLQLALAPVLDLADPEAFLVALIKPQFELGPNQVGKGGIVRDKAAQDSVCGQIAEWLGAQPDWTVLGVRDSPITGLGGNREFLIAARKAG